MSSNPVTDSEAFDPFVEEREPREHAPEPWQQDGRYIRDARGAIVVRGRTAADARRIVAAINGTRGIPTAALESWRVEDVSDPESRPDFEIDLAPEPGPSPFAVSPPPQRERRQRERRAAATVTSPEMLVFDRRVFDRRREDRRRA
jgi:hypothetical protein